MEKERHEPLSDRERQIALLAAEGLTDKEIARNLKVSVTTVRTYWMRIRKKVDATNRAQAIVRALESNGSGETVAALKRDAALTRILAGCALGVAATSSSGDLVSANDAFLCIIGCDRATFERDGLRWRDLFPSDPANEAPLRREGAAADPKPTVKTMRHRDGHLVQVIWTATRLEPLNGVDVNCIIDLGESGDET